MRPKLGTSSAIPEGIQEMGTSAIGFSSQINFDVYGNPAYTIKDGGTLKRKP